MAGVRVQELSLQFAGWWRDRLVGVVGELVVDDRDVPAGLDPLEVDVGLLDPVDLGLLLAPQPPTRILLAGLQGSGKTTFAGKLALWLKGKSKRVLLASADIYRPAAIDQLERLARRGRQRDRLCMRSIRCAEKIENGLAVLRVRLLHD